MLLIMLHWPNTHAYINLSIPWLSSATHLSASSGIPNHLLFFLASSVSALTCAALSSTGRGRSTALPALSTLLASAALSLDSVPEAEEEEGARRMASKVLLCASSCAREAYVAGAAVEVLVEPGELAAVAGAASCSSAVAAAGAWSVATTLCDVTCVCLPKPIGLCSPALPGVAPTVVEVEAPLLRPARSLTKRAPMGEAA